MIDKETNAVTGTIKVGARPIGVAFTPNGSRAYVANSGSNSVSVINTATNSAIATVKVGSFPQDWPPLRVDPVPGFRIAIPASAIDTATNSVVATITGIGTGGVAFTPDGTSAYVTNLFSSSVSVIDIATNSVVAAFSNVFQPVNNAITPDGTRAYVTNSSANFGSVSVIETASNAAIAPIGVGPDTQGLGMTPDGTRAYVASFGSNSVFVIDTATNTLSAKILGGFNPVGAAIAPSSLTTLTSSLSLTPLSTGRK